MSMRSGTDNGGCGCGRKDFHGADDYVTGAELGDALSSEAEETLNSVIEEF